MQGWGVPRCSLQTLQLFPIFEGIYDKMLEKINCKVIDNKLLYIWRSPEGFALQRPAGGHEHLDAWGFLSPRHCAGYRGWMMLADLQVSETSAACKSLGLDQVSGPDVEAEISP